MIEQLFGSKTRVKLLRLFYSNPNRSFYVREITRKIDEQINSVRRELANLLSIGIIASDNTNNRLYYEVNQTFEFYRPLLTVFGGEKSDVEPKDASAVTDDQAVPSSEREKIKRLGNVDVAIYTGQFTRDDSAGVDFLVVGDVNQRALQKFITELETQEGKELRFTVFSTDEFEYRRKIKDRFVDLIISAKKQVLIDKNNILQ
jgi:hypothetical protein